MRRRESMGQPSGEFFAACSSTKIDQNASEQLQPLSGKTLKYGLIHRARFDIRSQWLKHAMLPQEFIDRISSIVGDDIPDREITLRYSLL
jgi:hypothetical protein